MMKTFNPGVQLSLCQDSSACIFGDYPSLAVMKSAFGFNAPIAWLVPQLYNLSEYCGCRDKLQGAQLEECAGVIATNFYWLKISEMMLFFHRFKSGMYGRFYGSVDPLIIIEALRKFVSERNTEIDKRESEERMRRIEESRKGTMTYQEFLKLKQQQEEQKNESETDCNEHAE